MVSAPPGEPGSESDELGLLSRFLGWVKAKYGRFAVFGGGLLLLVVTILVTHWVDPEPVGISDGASRYGGAADVFRSLLWISFATGLIAMALTQMIKYVLNIRGRFHRHELQQYFGYNPPNESPYTQLKEAINETTWGQRYAGRKERGSLARGYAHELYVWSLPLEQLAGQLAAAGEVAIMEDTKLRLQRAEPQPEGGPYQREFGLLLARLAGQSVDELDEAVRASRRRSTPSSGAGAGESRGVGEAETEESFEERLMSAELAQRVQRGIDIIQIVIGHRWRWLVRAASLFLCAPIAWVVVAFTDATGSAHVLAAVVATVLGGFLAWFTRDLAAAVEARRS